MNYPSVLTFLAIASSLFAKGPSLKVSSLSTIDLPGSPFGVVATADGSAVFVSLAGMRNGVPIGIAVLRADQGRFKLDHVVPLRAAPTEMVLTHDGKSLVVAAGEKVLVLNTERLIAGKNPEAAAFSDGHSAGSIFANLTADDRTLFVSDEGTKSITVVDLARIRAEGFSPSAILGKIPVGLAPIALTFSPDEQWLYTTSEVADRSWGWPAAVPREGARGSSQAATVPEGAIIVVDVAKARTDPVHSIVSRVPAGGSAVRLALSSAGDRLYVTARNSNAVLVFDTEKLRTDPTHARLATVPVGASPVPLILVDEGRKLLVGNSDRFAQNGSASSSITVVDTTRVTDGAEAVLGSLPSGAFPREFRLMPDGHTLLLTNFSSRSLQVMSVDGDLTK